VFVTTGAAGAASVGAGAATEESRGTCEATGAEEGWAIFWTGLGTAAAPEVGAAAAPELGPATAPDVP
jgi:hypothetical protein